MRRSIAVMALAGLVLGLVGAPVAEAKKKRKVTRTAEAVYTIPMTGVGGVQGLCFLDDYDCIQFDVTMDEAFVTLEVTDQTGTAVWTRAAQDLDGNGSWGGPNDLTHTFCGSSGKPLSIVPGVALFVSVYRAGNPPCQGMATTGTISATFSNRP